MRLRIAELTKVLTTKLFVDARFVQPTKVATNEKETEETNNVLGRSTGKQSINKKNEKHRRTSAHNLSHW